MEALLFKPGSRIQHAITCTCLMAFFLFGYDQGVFGGIVTNPEFLRIFHYPSAGLIGIIVSIYNIGCLLGCIVNFFIGEKIGRKKAIWLAMVLTSIGAIIQCASFHIAQLMIGRVITGMGWYPTWEQTSQTPRELTYSIGVGIDSSTVPMYQSELCKSKYRGRLVTFETLFIGIGITVAYFFVFGLSFTQGSFSWRLPIAMQIAPALAICVVVFGVPESPRWLAQKGRPDVTTSTLSYVFDLPEDDPYIVEERDSILNAVTIEGADRFNWKELFIKDAIKTNYRVLLAFYVLFQNQWTGINVIVFYAPSVLEQNVGLERTIALVVSGCIQLCFVIGSIVPAWGLDKIGRRKLMMFGSLGMALSMMLIAILLSFHGTEKQLPTSQASIAFLITVEFSYFLAFIGSTVFPADQVMQFMLCFGASLSPIPWCYSTEVLPLRVRAQGTSLAVMNNWIWVFAIVMLAPIMVEKLAWKTYLIFMAMNVVFMPVVYFFFPETTGLKLEEIDYLFIEGSPTITESTVVSSATENLRPEIEKA